MVGIKRDKIDNTLNRVVISITLLKILMIEKSLKITSLCPTIILIKTIVRVTKSIVHNWNWQCQQPFKFDNDRLVRWYQ